MTDFSMHNSYIKTDSFFLLNLVSVTAIESKCFFLKRTISAFYRFLEAFAFMDRRSIAYINAVKAYGDFILQFI